MELIVKILGLASLAILWLDIVDTIDEDEKLPQKPFKCALCMGYWISVVPMIVTYGTRGIYIAAIVSIVTELTDRFLHKWN